VFKVGEGQATVETAGARNDLQPSVMRKETNKQATVGERILKIGQRLVKLEAKI